MKKDTAPRADAQTFGLTSTLAGLNGQSISDTADASGDAVALDVVPGSYTLNETVPAGWDFTSVVCIDPDGGTTANGSAVTLDVDALETITCTYTNTKRAQLTVAKVTKPGSGTGQAANTTDNVRLREPDCGDRLLRAAGHPDQHHDAVSCPTSRTR